MIKKVDVYFAGRPMYHEMVASPPGGVEYVDMHPSYDDDPFKEKKRARDRIGELGLFGDLATYMYRARHKPALAGSNLAHLCNTWIPLERPYVVDYENAGVFVDFNWKRLNKGFYRKFIEKQLAKKECRKIISLTKYSEDSFKKAFKTKELESKMTVSYPSMRNIEFANNRDSDVVNFLFIGFSSWAKRPVETMEAFKRLSKRMDVSLTMITKLPEPLHKKYSRLSNFSLFDFVPRENIYSYLYPSADIFVLPTLADSLGFVFIEAMNYRLPIISTNHLHIPELIDEQGGILVDVPDTICDEEHRYNPKAEARMRKTIEYESLTDNVYLAMKELAENNSPRKKMGTHNKKKIETGRFSLNVRNKQLKEIYEEA